ncbi:FkbM family methyltransferase [Flavobacterium daemonense]|uniref:FkbM family methyltransferase n=1 Tax=Flavobacterium daemonense TaxID=1393049 RepID=UPI001186FBF4|nr:FkbM family methyltransferase [Flavobacterium daemonense]KAF2333103.1 FkbM family methyltransferase [Flavobacterium daemonense]
MKILMILNKKINYLKNVLHNYKVNVLTKDYAYWYFLKYLYINFLLYFFNKEVEFTFLDNIKVKAKKGDGIVGNFHSILQEPNESLFLLHYLSSEDHFLDVGANVGHYSLIAASKTGANVIAIEPVPQTFKRLQQNIKLNNLQDKVILHNIGLSDSDGVLFFTEGLNTTNRVSSSQSGIEVGVKSLDNLFCNNELNLIKIDVEGYEWFVLKGGIKTLNKKETNVIIIELNDSSENFNIDESKVIDMLTNAGFNAYRYDIFERELIPLKDKNHKQFNTIFIKDIDLARERINRGVKVKLSQYSI